MAILQQLQKMDPYDFEELVADVWEAMGYDTHVRKGSQDRGIDIEAVRGRQKALIQAKRYSSDNKVGSEEVRKYATLWQQEPDASRVVIVTTSTFTSEGKKVAAEQNVTIVDGPSFVEMMKDEGVDAPKSQGTIGGSNTTSGFEGNRIQAKVHDQEHLQTTQEFNGSLAVLILGVLICLPVGFFYYFSEIEEMLVCPACQGSARIGAEKCPSCGEHLNNWENSLKLIVLMKYNVIGILLTGTYIYLYLFV